MLAPLESGRKISFEEYKMYYESTEKVTDRRLDYNKWNYSICTAIIIGISGIIAWSLGNKNYVLICLVTVPVLCVMAALFCSLWIGQIDGFKLLNDAKFKVLNDMVKYVPFSSTNTDQRVSYCPFEREWNLLQEKKDALEELSRHKT